jgi:aspartyl-tRNA(Asn)/glutamyl-tRNA(Gln) amidotransferase subunit A
MSGSLDGSWMRRAAERNAAVGAFLQLDPSIGAADSAASGPLAGLAFGVKDNIAVRGYQLTCGSRLLEGVVSPYTATAVGRLQHAGAVVAGKTNLDEFGMGSSTENSAFKHTVNPFDPGRVPGGSSGGSAAAVAAGIVDFALGSDTGGSVRQPASFCGLFGLKPTYGAVSRYGLVAYASSLEVIGVLAKTVDLVERVFAVMRGEDPRDHSSLPWKPAPRRDERPLARSATAQAARSGSTRPRVGLPRECTGEGLAPEVRRALETTKERLAGLGHPVVEVELPTLEHVVAAYYVIATAEASANLARFDGIRYGRRAEGAVNPEELVLATRSAGFGDEVKLRILLGTYVLRSGFQDQYYLRAQKVRTAIRADFERVFDEVDLLLMPVYPVPPFAPGSAEADPFAQKLADVYTCSANLAGLPALAFPAALESGLPIGMQFVAPAFAEDRLFEACRGLEKVFPSPDPPDSPRRRSAR